MKKATTKKPRHKVPDGIYPSTLLNYQPAMTNNGLRYQFVFALDGWTTSDGEQITLMRTTSPSLAPQSHRRVILEALMKNRERHNYDDLFNHPEDKILAMSVEYEEEDCARVKPSALVGTQCALHVQNQKNKAGTEYSNIEAVFPSYK